MKKSKINQVTNRKQSTTLRAGEAQRILGALNNQAYVARTIPGIAREAGMQVSGVIRAIKQDPQLRTVVKVYPRRTSSGQVLVTTRDKFSKKASLKDKFIDLFATRLPELDDAG